MRNPGKCVVLTGINAGGKTLILNSLEKFGHLLCEPNSLNLSRFEYLFRVADVKSISVTYSGRWWTLHYDHPLPDDWYDVEVDLSKYCEAATFSNAREGSHAPPYEFHPMVEHLDDLSVWQHYQTRCSMGESGSLIYERRVGMEIWAEASVVQSHNQSGLPELGADINELFWGGWKRIFTDTSRLEEEKMYSAFGHEHTEQLVSRTGIDLNDEHSSEIHSWWKRKKAIHIITRPPLMISVEEAYRMSPARLESLLKATKDMKSPESANQRLKASYDELYERKKAEVWEDFKDMTGAELKDELRGRQLPVSGTKSELIARIQEVLALVGTNFKVYGQFAILKKRFEIDGYYPPTVIHPSLPPERISFPDGPDDDVNLDTEKIDYLATMNEFGSFLRMHDSDLAFWLGMWGFFGATIFDTGGYFSSGQSRILSMLSTIVDAPSGTTFLIDEPELSLHIDWQRNLIDVISSSERRLIVATHSPDIIYNHPEKVVEVPPSPEV